MKRTLFSLFLTFTALHVFSQESRPLTFKGIPMGGPVDEFVSQIEDRGFEFKDRDLLIMCGNFAGFSSCNLYILPLYDKVCSISVCFPEYKNWESLRIIYDGLQKSLITKYGEPAEVIEEFQTNPQPTTDSLRMAALHAGECRYLTRFRIGQQNSINLSINSIKADSVFKDDISLTYTSLILINDFIDNLYPETDTIPAVENVSRNNGQ